MVLREGEGANTVERLPGEGGRVRGGEEAMEVGRGKVGGEG